MSPRPGAVPDPQESAAGAPVPERLLVLISSMDRGGKEAQVADVVREIDPGRYRPVLGVLHAGELLAEVQCPVRPRLARYRGDPLFLWRLLGLFREARPAVVWCAGPGWLSLAAQAICHVTGVPVVVSVHGVELPDEPIFTVPERWLIRRVARFVVLSEAYRPRLTREGVGAERIRVQPNGIDLSRFRPFEGDRREERRRRGWGEGPVVGHVGQMRPSKSQDVLLEAFARVHRELPNARLVMVGDGRLRPGLESLRSRLGLVQAVHMIGARDDVADLMPLFDVFVLSSQTDAGPLVLMEAMASGVPVVATDVDGNREVAGDGGCGVLVPAADPGAIAAATLRLLQDPERAAAMGRRGRERAEALFATRRLVDERMALFDEVIAAARGAA